MTGAAVASGSGRRMLVTGGSGFIGTHLIDLLVQQCHTVRNLDLKRPRADREPLWQALDLADPVRTREAVAKFAPDVIFNLAANADVASSVEQMAVNTVGLQNLIDASLALPMPARIIHASTQYVSGPEHVASGPRDYAPYTEYGATKAASEELLWKAPDALPWTIVRPSTVWGPGHAQFPRTIWRFIDRGWYMLPTGIDPVRSYGYVGNVVHQLVALGAGPGQAIDRRIFYVGDAPVRSSEWLDGFSRRLRGAPVRLVPGFALRALAELGEWSRRLGGPSPIDRGRLYRMTRDYVVPMEPTFALVGKGPYSLSAGIDLTAHWLKTGD